MIAFHQEKLFQSTREETWSKSELEAKAVALTLLKVVAIASMVVSGLKREIKECGGDDKNGAEGERKKEKEKER